ncbi:Hypothetical protein I5071_47470 [Sandaracinus amylolyticus]|nr:Hypothetical protein I5071_47470 [Sandaracinus amylolyticus]
MRASSAPRSASPSASALSPSPIHEYQRTRRRLTRSTIGAITSTPPRIINIIATMLVPSNV